MQQAVVTVLKLRETTKKMITKFTLAPLFCGVWVRGGMRTLEGPIKNFILKDDFFRVSTSSKNLARKLAIWTLLFRWNDAMNYSLKFMVGARKS